MAASSTILFKKLNGAITHIFPPFISVLYLSLNGSFIYWNYQKIGGFVLSACLIAAFGYLVNDAADIELDKKAKKKNSVANVSLPTRIMAALVLSAGGILVFGWINTWNWITVLIGIEVLILILYSIPPFRLKRTALGGPFLDAHYSHILPVLMAAFVFFDLNSPTPDQWILIAGIYVFTLFKGLRNILSHQLDDRKTDKQDGIQTFPNRFGALCTLHLINRFILPVEFILASGLLIFTFPDSAIISFGFAGFLFFYILNFSAWKFFRLPYRQLKFKFLYFFNDFYEFWFPYLCIWSTGLDILEKIALTLLHAMIFYHGIVKFTKETKKIGINLGIIKTT